MHTVRVADEMGQQPELHLGEIEFASVEFRGMPCRIDVDDADSRLLHGRWVRVGDLSDLRSRHALGEELSGVGALGNEYEIADEGCGTVRLGPPLGGVAHKAEAARVGEW